MKTIAGVIIFAILLDILLLFLFGIPFDNNFWSSFLIGLLSNLIILVIAIFIIDELLKKKEKIKLKEINKEKSLYIHYAVNILLLKILKHLKVFPKDIETKDILNKNADLTFKFAFEKMTEIAEKENIDKIVGEIALKERDRKKYFEDLSEIIFKDITSINNGLKEIYPHPAPDITALTNDVFANCGALKAFSAIADVKSQVNKIIPKGQKKMDEITATALLKIMMFNPKQKSFSTIAKNLIVLSKRAEGNSLFII